MLHIFYVLLQGKPFLTEVRMTAPHDMYGDCYNLAFYIIKKPLWFQTYKNKS